MMCMPHTKACVYTKNLWDTTPNFGKRECFTAFCHDTEDKTVSLRLW